MDLTGASRRLTRTPRPRRGRFGRCGTVTPFLSLSARAISALERGLHRAEVARHESGHQYSDRNGSLCAADDAGATADERGGAPVSFGEAFTSTMALATWDERYGWGELSFSARRPLLIDPAMVSLHYRQAVFEGLKAYRQNDGRLALLRPDAHAGWMQLSACRLGIPEPPANLCVAAVSGGDTAGRSVVVEEATPYAPVIRAIDGRVSVGLPSGIPGFSGSARVDEYQPVFFCADSLSHQGTLHRGLPHFRFGPRPAVGALEQRRSPER